jgi:hypothetical protein
MVVHAELLYQAFGLIIIAFFDVHDRVGALHINGKGISFLLRARGLHRGATQQVHEK